MNVVAMTRTLVSGQISLDSIRESNAQRTNIINELRRGGQGIVADPDGTPLQQALHRTTMSMYEQMGEVQDDIRRYQEEMANYSADADMEYQTYSNTDTSVDVEMPTSDTYSGEYTPITNDSITARLVSAYTSTNPQMTRPSLSISLSITFVIATRR